MTSKQKRNIVLIVGDGFSRSMREAAGVSTRINTEVLIPASTALPLLDPRTRKPDVVCPTFSLQRSFPELQKAWTTFAAGVSKELDARSLSYQFFEYVAANGHVNRAEEYAGVDYTTFHIGYQLRCYLWCLFYAMDQLFENRQYNELGVLTWPWQRALKHLSSTHCLTVISFNYDRTAERALSISRVPIACPPDDCRLSYEDRPDGTVLVLKPHGCISFDSATAINLGDRPWLRQIAISNCVDVRFGYDTHRQIARFPSLPEIVPPGHAGTHLSNRRTNVVAMGHRVVSEAEGVILCGLSAQSPDTEEVESLLSKIARPGVPSLHIGLTGNDTNDAARLLKQYSAYDFALAADFGRDWECVVSRLEARLT